MGHVCDGSSCSQQHSDWYCNPMVIVLLWFLAMKNVAIAGLGVTYIRSTGEHAPATIVGPSTRGDDFIHLKYMRNGHEWTSFTSPKILLMTVLSPKIGSLNLFPNPKGKHVQLIKMKRKVGKSFYSVPVDGQ